MKARDVMTTQVTTVRVDTPVRTVAQLMLEAGVSGLPVVDDEGILRGIASEGDLMRRAESGTDQHKRSWWLRLVGSEDDEARDYVKTHGATAGDVMSHPVISVSPDADLGELAFTLEKRRIKRVPVAEAGRLLGVVSRADLLRALAARDEQRSGRGFGSGLRW
jgi:CBS domain-containing protein